MDSLEQSGRIYFEKDFRLPRLKVYAEDANMQTVDTVWNNIETSRPQKHIQGGKSKELLDRIIKLFAEEGDVVLDPFAGSGVCGVSAFINNREWIGIEIDEIAFKHAKTQLKNFDIKIMDIDQLLENRVVWNSYTSLNLSKSEAVLQKIKEGENELVEFKESYIYNDSSGKKDNNMPNKIMKEIAAFLNSQYGGSIFLGVRDNGELRGLQNDIAVIDSRTQKIDKLELAITSKIKDTFGGSVVDLVSLRFLEIEDKIICEIQISTSENPIFLKKEFHVRHETQALTLKVQEFFELLHKRKRVI